MYTNHGSAVIICQEHGAYASFELSCLIAHFLFCTTGNSSTYIKETRVLAYLYMSMGEESYENFELPLFQHLNHFGQTDINVCVCACVREGSCGSLCACGRACVLACLCAYAPVCEPVNNTISLACLVKCMCASLGAYCICQ